MQVLIKNEVDETHIFQYTCYENFQTHLQIIMYQFERKKHDIHLDFLFQSFSILILHIYNQHL